MENIFINLFIFFLDIDGDSEYCIQDDEAMKISDTVKKYANEIDEFVVHCVYGQGRSPAVGYAIAKYLGINDIDYKKKYPEMNYYVYNKIKKFLIPEK